MADQTPKIGTIGWLDLTVPNADAVRDFYAAVVGWSHDGIDMGGYADYVMKAPNGEAVGGVCHARGVNAKVPPSWIPYAIVADLAACVAKVKSMGGTIVDGPRGAGGGQMCIIKDPAGAVFGLYQS